MADGQSKNVMSGDPSKQTPDLVPQGQANAREQKLDPTRLDFLKDKYPDYGKDHKHWQMLDAIAAGGRKADDMKKQLLANPDGRPDKVTKERLKVATLVNKIGPIVTRVVAQIFTDRLVIEGTKQPWLKTFLERGARLPATRDGQVSFEQFLRAAAFQLLVQGEAIAHVDAAAVPEAATLAEQESSGALEPRVVLRSRWDMWDFEMGDRALGFAKLHQFSLERPNGFRGHRSGMHSFTVYEQEGDTILASRYEVRRRVDPMKNEKPPTEPFIDQLQERDAIITPYRLQDGSLLDRREVFRLPGRVAFPIVTCTLPDNLWLTDQCFPLQKEHFNNRAGIDWKTLRANFSMPYIRGGNRDPMADKKIGDGYYIWLPDGYEMGEFALNTAGLSTAMEVEKAIEEDFYEALQQIAFAAQQSASGMQRSEESRIIDRNLEQIMLESYGGYLLTFAKRIIEVAAIAAGDPIEPDDWKISGLSQFQTRGLMSYLPLFQGAQQVVAGVPLNDFKRRIYRDVIARYGDSLELPHKDVESLQRAVDSIPDDKLDPTPLQTPSQGEGPGEGPPRVGRKPPPNEEAVAQRESEAEET